MLFHKDSAEDHDEQVTQLMKRLARTETLLLDLLWQACGHQAVKFPGQQGPTEDYIDHRFISAYENAQRYLVEVGLLEQQQCQYGA